MTSLRPVPLPSSAAEDPLARKVAEAQAKIQRAVERSGLRNDAYGDILAALVEVIGLFPEHTRAMAEARQPIGPEDLRQLTQAAAHGADARAMTLARAHNWRTLAIAAACALVLLAGGVAGGWYLRGDGGLQTCIAQGTLATDKATGQHYCTFWLH